MVKVIKREKESDQQLVKRFRKRVSQSGKLKQARKKRWFVSKNEQRRLAKKKAIRRQKRRERRFNRNYRNQRR